MKKQVAHMEHSTPFSTTLRCQAARLPFWLFRFKSVPRARRLFRSITSPCYLKRSLFGQTFMVDVSRSMTHQLLFLEGERFVEERHLLAGLLRTGMHVVDIGANIGYYLLMFEQGIGPDGKVTMFEPSQENLPELKANIDLNGFRNTILHECAIGSVEGVTGLKAGINSGVVDVGEGAYEVSIRTLNSTVNESVDFIKIDVEGYEGLVLEGASEVIRRDRPILFVEMHPHLIGNFGFTCSGVVSSLREVYDKVVFFRVMPATHTGVLTKTLKCYANKDVVMPVAEQEAHLAACDARETTDTFWIVCRP